MHLIDNPLNDPNGNGLIYANHTYPFKGDTIEQWLAKMEKASEMLPIIISEFGSETRRRRPGHPPAQAEANDTPTLNPAGLTDRAWVEAVLKACDDHNWHWTAWDLHPAAGPRLIADWNYTPTPNFGVPTKASLTGETHEAKP